MTDLGCLGIIQSRFRLFQHDSRPISACFGHWPIRLDSANTALFWPNLPYFGQICSVRRKSSRVVANPRKKKCLHATPTRGQSRRTPHPTSGRVELRCGTFPAAFVLHRVWVPCSFFFVLISREREQSLKCFFFFFLFLQNFLILF